MLIDVPWLGLLRQVFSAFCLFIHRDMLNSIKMRVDLFHVDFIIEICNKCRHASND